VAIDITEKEFKKSWKIIFKTYEKYSNAFEEGCGKDSMMYFIEKANQNENISSKGKSYWRKILDIGFEKGLCDKTALTNKHTKYLNLRSTE